MKKGVFTKILAVAGTVLVWIPILAPILFSLAVLITRRMFHFDYLMPAELFPSALAGGLLLLWAALREGAHRSLIGWSFASAIALLFSGQGLAVVTGLASGKTNPVGWVMIIVLGAIISYTLALVVLGVGGVLLLRDLFKSAYKAPDEKSAGRV